MEGLLIAAAALIGAAAFGLWRRRVDGRLRPVAAERTGGAVTHNLRTHNLRADQLGKDLGHSATFVSFSTAFCQPCRANRQVLARLAVTTDGVEHIEIDAESRLDLVRALGVTRTPTTFVLDATGAIRHRATGALRLADAQAVADGFVDA